MKKEDKMELEKITKYVVSYCEIPEELTEDYQWLKEAACDSYVEAHVDDEETDELSIWLLERYPQLKDEESFFIHMDY